MLIIIIIGRIVIDSNSIKVCLTNTVYFIRNATTISMKMGISFVMFIIVIIMTDFAVDISSYLSKHTIIGTSHQTRE